MGKKVRGKKDGTGPFEDSFQNIKFGIGKRKQLGEECPFEIKKKVRRDVNISII